MNAQIVEITGIVSGVMRLRAAVEMAKDEEDLVMILMHFLPGASVLSDGSTFVAQKDESTVKVEILP